MADTGYQLVMNAIAQIVGGTVSPKNAHFFSGALAGDLSGVAGLKGCYSTDPPSVEATPVGIVIPAEFQAELRSQGEETQLDKVTLVILAAPYAGAYELPLLNPFRDTIPAVFRSHMSALFSAGVESCWVRSGRARIHTYNAVDYLAWEFTIELDRALSVTYTP